MIKYKLKDLLTALRESGVEAIKMEAAISQEWMKVEESHVRERALKAELAQAREAIEKAPHDVDCEIGGYYCSAETNELSQWDIDEEAAQVAGRVCNCWKADD